MPTSRSNTLNEEQAAVEQRQTPWDAEFGAVSASLQG